MFFLVCAAAAAMRFSPLPLALLAVAGFVLMPALDIPLKGMGRAAAGLALLSLFAALFRGMFPGDGRMFAAETLPLSALYAMRLFSLFFFARLFYASTKAADLGDHISAAARKLRALRDFTPARQSPSQILADPGMFFSLSLLFLPRVFETYRKVKEAAEVRAYGLCRRPGEKLKKTPAMLQTFMFESLKGALRASTAMEARGYSPGRTLDSPRFAPRDAVIILVGCLLFALALVGV